MADLNNGTMQASSKEVPSLEPIAIIGFALKLPQEADSPEGFWKILEEKRSVMTGWPDDRVNLEAFFHRQGNERDQNFVPGANFLKEDLAAFDAPFFGISATEAMAMDPQHRLLLETTYHALESAGVPMEKVNGSKTGVYTGCMTDDYKHIVTRDLDDLPKYAATGIPVSMLANRISWFYNFRGPSVNFDSACSSSLMAFDIACQGLRNGDCSMAVVGGTSMTIAAEALVSLIKLGFLSPSGRCYSFDERADGYARGEGISVVLLKKLKDAIKDGDTIRAVVRSTGSNQDGRTPGITQPSSESQAALISETYKKAGLKLDDTRFFEAHGTGTPLGDPVEATAIGRTFRTARSRDDPLYVGALKSNIGHLEGGSGLAGIIKAVLVLEKAIIPPNANFETLNPKIDADFFNMKFPTECVPWPSSGLRRASVASFGFGGSNAHAILDDAYNFLLSNQLSGIHRTSRGPPSSICSKSVNEPLCLPGVNGQEDKRLVDGKLGAGESIHPKDRLLVLSAADENGLKRLAELYQSHFRNNIKVHDEHSHLDRLAYTLSTRRSTLQWKSFVVVDSLQALGNLPDMLSKPVFSQSSQQALAFVFTGQGAQYRKMGAELLVYAEFKEMIELFDQELISLGSSWSVIDKLTVESCSEIDDPEFSQPMTTALQIALYELLYSLGMVATTVIGHSSGEIAAAYAAGGLSLRSACKTSYYRGQYASALRKLSGGAGAMMSVNLPEHDMRSFITDHPQYESSIHISCINSPANITISGGEAAIKSVESDLGMSGIATRKLNTGVAYHSPYMSLIANQYFDSIGEIEKSANLDGRPCMISSVTGERIQDLSELSKPDYWVANMVSPVEFSKAMSSIRNTAGKKQSQRLGGSRTAPIHDIVEIGPHAALRRPILECLKSTKSQFDIRYHSSLERGVGALQTLLRLLGEMYSLGHNIDIRKVNRMEHLPLAELLQPIDLPYYPFNHSRLYWHEAAVSRHGRLRNAPKHEILGTPVPDWNPLQPRWRKFFDLAETPWVEDHKVNGRTIYPATGMVAMAVEGATQIADPNRTITGYLIRDAVFSAPITLGESGISEVQLHMRPLDSQSDKNSSHFEYRVLSLSHAQWAVNCHGSIQVIYGQPGSESQRSQDQFYREKYDEDTHACNRAIATDEMYQHFEANGLNYGDAFQVLDELAWDGKNRAVGKIQCFQWTPNHSLNGRQPHVAHPTTMDAVGQLVWVALTRGGQDLLAKGVAVTRIQSAWISSSGLSYPDTTHLLAACSTSWKGLRGTDSTVYAMDPSGNLKLVMAHLETTSIEGNEAQPSYGDQRQICFDMSYKPDLDMMSAAQQLALMKAPVELDSEPVTFYEDLELALLYFVSRAVQSLEENGTMFGDSQPHVARYVDWLRHQLHEYRVGEMQYRQQNWTGRIEDTSAMGQLIDRVESSNSIGEFLVRMGRHIESIIRGQVNPLELMFQHGHSERFYEENCDNIMQQARIESYLDALGHKTPRLRMLEIGAGTGSFTKHILGAFDPEQEGLGHYDYTDISESFFERAREKFSAFGSKIGFKLLNIEKDPAAQGFQTESYDVIIAGWVLHATKNLTETLQNVRRLLKPGGKLVLLELTEPHILRSGVAFGTLPGWWLGTEKHRNWSPCVSEHEWKHLLEANGFLKTEIVLQDYQSSICREHSILIATADSPCSTKESSDSSIIVLLNPNSKLQTTIAESLRGQLQGFNGADCQVLPYWESEMVSQDCKPTLIVLTELDETHLSSLNESSLETLKTQLRSARNVIWGVSLRQQEVISADLQMVRGFARVLSTEKPSMTFVTLTFEDQNVSEHEYVRHMYEVVSTTLTKQTCELEYVLRDGLLMINRTVKAPKMNQEIHHKTQRAIRYLESSQTPPLTLTVPNAGVLDSLRFEEDPEQHLDLAADEIEIEVHAVGVNFRDLLVVLGRLGSRTVGCECAGVVTRVGANCTNVQPGDRVCAVSLGCVKTFARFHHQLAVKIPDSISTAEAAALPITGSTAYYSLVTLANLQKGESILIHCGAGGTGQMALQIAQSIGADVYVTVGTEDKRQLMRDIYGIPDSHIFYSRDQTFANDVFRATHGQGVDVVLNSLAGESLLASWECIAPLGRFIELGKSDIESNSKLPMSRFDKNVAFFAVSVDFLSIHRPLMLGNILQSVIDMVASKRINVATPLHIHPISEIEAAFRMMQSGKNTGKVVLSWSPKDVIPTFLKPKFTCRLKRDGTYLIAGGLGGLGRSAARWMAARGARNLILLSRSGPNSAAARELLEDLQSSGVTVRTPRCDVSSAESLSSALRECSDLPPIMGCLQATMVLQDVLFENMQWDQWSTSIRSKVTSTGNLHHQLPRGLDFFIMLSSVNGISGWMGQANYAAGNTYQDALAAHRLAIGERAVSIDLGWMSDVGIGAEKANVSWGNLPIAEAVKLSESEFLALLDSYCDPESATAKNKQAQSIVGLITPAALRSNGVEPPDWMIERPLLSSLAQHESLNEGLGSNGADAAGGGRDWVTDFMRATSQDESSDIVVEALVSKLSKATSISAEDIDRDRPLHVYGVDSLLAVELRNWFGKMFKTDVAIFDIIGHESLRWIGGIAAQRSELKAKNGSVSDQ